MEGAGSGGRCYGSAGSSQEPENSAGHAYEACDDLRDEFFIGKRNARGSPALLE